MNAGCPPSGPRTPGTLHATPSAAPERKNSFSFPHWRFGVVWEVRGWFPICSQRFGLLIKEVWAARLGWGIGRCPLYPHPKTSKWLKTKSKPIQPTQLEATPLVMAGEKPQTPAVRGHCACRCLQRASENTHELCPKTRLLILPTWVLGVCMAGWQNT